MRGNEVDLDDGEGGSDGDVDGDVSPYVKEEW
jgi:hypothetical protein